MKLKNIRYYIALAALALVAMLGIQLYWVRHAFALGEKEFDQEVRAALEKTALAINNNAQCFEVFGKISLQPGQGFYIARQEWKDGPEGDRFTSNSAIPFDSIPLFYYYAAKDTLLNFNNFMTSYAMSGELILKCRYDTRDSLTQASIPLRDAADVAGVTSRNFRDKLSDRAGLFDRIDSTVLDSLLHAEMAMTVPGSDFEYGIIKRENDSLAWRSKGASPTALLQSKAKASLLDDKYFGRPYYLAVYFPERNKLLVNAISGILILSVLVILILVYAFWYFVRMILKQKKLAEMKTDFINNMTHEFKTPITNISLALETLHDNAQMQLHNSARRERLLLNIIGEENSRLKKNVERILQIAMLDREEVQLEPEEVDVHGLIRKLMRTGAAATDSANFRCAIKAEKYIIKADATHLLNVLYNLLDNAVKYGGATQEVIIGTRNYAEGIVVFVTDKGIGMDKETQKHVFDMFYRAHTGDVHNVKGFGLGLSYVKNIVEAHKGYVEVDSEPGKGSTFAIYLPFEPVFKEMQA